MKFRRSHFTVLGGVMLITSGGLAQEVKKGGPPVEFPKLEQFAALWQRSIFTTKDLPSPDAPTGPNFAENLSLSGIYEIDGAVVAVLADRVTSRFTEARIGSENEMGIKIRKITPGETVERTRVQLQKGDQVGWVGVADAADQQPSEVVQRAVIPTQQAASAPGAVPNAVPQQQPRRLVPSAAPIIPAVNPILPPPPAATRASPVNDVPLPPP